MNAIKVFIVSDSEQMRMSVRKVFSGLKEFEISGDSSSKSCFDRVKQEPPDLVVIDFKDSSQLGLIEALYVDVPETSIIIFAEPAVDESAIKSAMLAGARECISGSADWNKMVETAKKHGEMNQRRKESLGRKGTKETETVKYEKVISIFSTKGGVGKTVIAVNLALALAKYKQGKVCIIDLDLQFGDVAILMNIIPKATIADMAREIDRYGEIDDNFVETFLFNYNGQLKVLPAPFRPEEGEYVKGEHINKILKVLRSKFDYIVIDVPKYLHDTALVALEASDEIFLILEMDVPTIKNGKLCTNIMKSLNYSADKVKIILNRADTRFGITPKDVEEVFDFPVVCQLPSDGNLVLPSVNNGKPFVSEKPGAPISRKFYELVEKIISGTEGKKPSAPDKRNFWDKLKKK